MRKTYINYLLFSLFAFALLCATSGSIDNREKQVHKLVSSASWICEETDVMARQSSIEPVIIFVLLTFVLIDCYFVKSYLWKAELPVFWGCKFRIQSPRCKLMKSNICSVFCLIYSWNRCIVFLRDFGCVFAGGRLKNMDYKEMLIYLINELDDNRLIESLFYIVQKMIGRGI